MRRNKTVLDEEVAVYFDYQSLDRVLHSRVRTALMSVLLSLKEADFNTLKNLSDLTDGNLITHLRILERAGYVDHRREGRGRNASSTYWMTERGRRAFQRHVEALEQMVRFGG